MTKRTSCLIISLLFFSNTLRSQVLNEHVHRNIGQAKIIVVAEILEIGKEPGYWSGLFLATQTVRYHIIETLKGRVPGREIIVRHLVVHNSETADPSLPRLNPCLFSKNHKVILFLSEIPIKERDPGLLQAKYETFDEHFGVIPDIPDAIKNIAKALQ